MEWPPVTREACTICGRLDAPRVAAIKGRRTDWEFHLRYCANCGFAWVDNPWTDFATVYDEAYYRGQGSDVLIDYVDELAHPTVTLRRWEWRGILDLLRELALPSDARRWLDFGCGNGGLVKYARETTKPGEWLAGGFEEGWAAQYGRSQGIPILAREDLAARCGSFDIVTAVEVMEHTLDPRETLREVRGLLPPGGVFLFTTGNLAPYAGNLAAWGYVAPEIHLSYFEPRALARLLEETGFEPRFTGYRPPHTGIIAYKILKTLGRKHLAPWMKLLPWSVLSRLAEWRARFTEFPLGIAR